MRGYRSHFAAGRPSATLPLCAAQAPMSVLRDESIEGTSTLSGNHQWKPNGNVEPPVM